MIKSSHWHFLFNTQIYTLKFPINCCCCFDNSDISWLILDDDSASLVNSVLISRIRWIELSNCNAISRCSKLESVICEFIERICSTSLRIASKASSACCETWWTWVALSLPDWIAETTLCVPDCRVVITCCIWTMDSWVRLASTRTSSATTAKPRPPSPARAASIAAFKASKLVCSAICWITCSIEPMLSESFANWFAIGTLSEICRANCEIAWPVSSTIFFPLSALS